VSGLAARLAAEGERRYHDRHPFQVAMDEGRLDRRRLQLWVENRYYYQTRIPIKDALVLSKAEDPAFRRRWIRRILEQDGARAGEGGLDRWLALAAGVGLDPGRVARCEGVLPGVREACDRYVELVRRGSLLEAVAASLTELFAPRLHARRIAAWAVHYPWIEPEALAYFQSRIPQGTRDAEEGLAYVVENATTPALEDACVAALVAKCTILWRLLDAVEAAT
jgi:pyrroloquinoline-quinone synthase